MTILLIVLMVVVLIFFVPYGVELIYDRGLLKFGVKAGPVKIWLLPRKEKNLSAGKQERLKKKQQKKAEKKRLKKLKKNEEKKLKAESHDETIELKEKKEFRIDFIISLFKMATHAIHRLFNSFNIDKFHFFYWFASDDPGSVATQYAYIGAALEAIIPVSDKVIHIKDRDIRIGIDFTKESPVIIAHCVVTLQLYKIVCLGIAFAAEFLIWKWRDRKKQRHAIERNNNGK